MLIVDREPSIGGKMIQLSKVFPTLDCSSCITTPKMSSAAHHPNITVWTYTEVNSVNQNDNSTFTAQLTRKARFVDEELCIGCQKCEYACPVDVPSEFEMGIGARKAIYIPFQTAIPQIAILDLDNCIACGKCERVCPADAVIYAQEDEYKELSFKTVIFSTGFELTPMEAKKEYGLGNYTNVISSMTMERLLSPNGPFGGIRRPSDGKQPFSAAFVLCAGSRDRSLGVPYCSRVCCMYSIKQAILLTGALPIVDVTIYYMDIRAFGKGFEQFYQNAKAMGINFVKAKVAKISEDSKTHDLTLKVESMEEDYGIKENTHDMVILALGLIPSLKNTSIFPSLVLGEDGFIDSYDIKINPTQTSIKGVFAGGVAIGPKDIVDTIVEGSASAMNASIYIENIQDEKSDIYTSTSVKQEIE